MTVAATAYHVRELEAAGMITLTSTQQVRGAMQHFYELTDAGQAALRVVEAVLRFAPPHQVRSRRQFAR